MQDEYLDILDASGNTLGKRVLKQEIHQKGYYHNTAHVWFYTKQGKILLQQRAKTKSICPLLWDVSVAGHVDAGETIIEAAIREIQEEIGLTITEIDLQKTGIFKCFKAYNNGIKDNEFHHTFISELKQNIDTLTINTNEVEAIKLISIAEFNQKLKFNQHNDNHFIASNKIYYETVSRAIKNVL